MNRVRLFKYNEINLLLIIKINLSALINNFHRIKLNLQIPTRINQQIHFINHIYKYLIGEKIRLFILMNFNN